MRKTISLIIINFFFAHSFTMASNGIDPSQYQLSKPSEFVFKTYKNQELISIRLLGAVNKAGLYHVPKNIQLTTLLSLAGGTTANANLEKIVVSNSEGKVKQGKLINLEQVLEKDPLADYKLQSNDIILVKNKKSFVTNNTWRIISIASVILTSVLTAIAIDDRI